MLYIIQLAPKCNSGYPLYIHSHHKHNKLKRWQNMAKRHQRSFKVGGYVKKRKAKRKFEKLDQSKG